MANGYQLKSPKAEENKKGLSNLVLKKILDYSRSLEVKKGMNQTMLIHLN